MLKKSASGVLDILSSSHRAQYVPGTNPFAALSEERRILAYMGWAGETAGLLEHALLRLEVLFTFSHGTGFVRIVNDSTVPYSTAGFCIPIIDQPKYPAANNKITPMQVNPPP